MGRDIFRFMRRCELEMHYFGEGYASKITQLTGFHERCLRAGTSSTRFYYLWIVGSQQCHGCLHPPCLGHVRLVRIVNRHVQQRQSGRVAHGGGHGRRQTRNEGGDAAGLHQWHHDTIDVRERHQTTQCGLLDWRWVVFPAITSPSPEPIACVSGGRSAQRKRSRLFAA